MKALLSGYNIGLSTIYEAWNMKVLSLFVKAAYLDLFILGTVLYNMPIFSITVNRPWRPPVPPAARVVARYDRPVAQKIATGLLYRRLKVWFHESKGMIFKIPSC